MSHPTDLLAPPARPASPASAVLRVFAALGALVLALFTLGMSLGIAAAAFVGIGAAWLLARRRDRPLGRKPAAIGALVGGMLGFAAVIAAIVAFMPPGSFDKIQRDAAAAQSKAQAEGKAPAAPDWMPAMSKEQAEASRAQAAALTESPTFMAAVMSGSAVFVIVFMGAASALGAWGTTMLLLVAARGRALPSSAQLKAREDAPPDDGMVDLAAT